MKLVSYLKEGHDQVSILVDGYLYDLDSLHPDMPNSMSMFLYWDDAYRGIAGQKRSSRAGSAISEQHPLKKYSYSRLCRHQPAAGTVMPSASMLNRPAVTVAQP